MALIMLITDPNIFHAKTRRREEIKGFPPQARCDWQTLRSGRLPRSAKYIAEGCSHCMPFFAQGCTQVCHTKMRTAAASSTKSNSKYQSRGRANGFFVLLHQSLILSTQLVANGFNCFLFTADAPCWWTHKNLTVSCFIFSFAAFV